MRSSSDDGDDQQRPSCWIVWSVRLHAWFALVPMVECLSNLMVVQHVASVHASVTWPLLLGLALVVSYRFCALYAALTPTLTWGAWLAMLVPGTTAYLGDTVGVRSTYGLRSTSAPPVEAAVTEPDTLLRLVVERHVRARQLASTLSRFVLDARFEMWLVGVSVVLGPYCVWRAALVAWSSPVHDEATDPHDEDEHGASGRPRSLRERQV